MFLKDIYRRSVLALPTLATVHATELALTRVKPTRTEFFLREAAIEPRLSFARIIQTPARPAVPDQVRFSLLVTGQHLLRDQSHETSIRLLTERPVSKRSTKYATYSVL